MASVSDEVAESVVMKSVLEGNIKVYESAFTDAINRAREIKNFPDSEPELAKLMVGMVAWKDQIEINRSSIAGIKDSLKKNMQEVGQQLLDLKAETKGHAFEIAGLGYLAKED